MTALDPRMVARMLGGDVIGRDSVLAPGPGHSKADRSLSIKIDSSAPQGFRVNSFSQKDDWQACRDHVCTMLGLERRGPTTAPVVRPRPAAIAPRPLAPSMSHLRIWKEAVSAKGTLAEKYLAGRGLALPKDHEASLRFHPSCPFGEGSRSPCMVGLYRDILTDEPKAIHRTALTPDGKKIDRKALGPKAGCAIKLSLDVDVEQGLTIAEGIETALAGMALVPGIRAE